MFQVDRSTSDVFWKKRSRHTDQVNPLILLSSFRAKDQLEKKDNPSLLNKMINYFCNSREAAAAAGENPKSKAEQVGPSFPLDDDVACED